MSLPLDNHAFCDARTRDGERLAPCFGRALGSSCRLCPGGASLFVRNDIALPPEAKRGD